MIDSSSYEVGRVYDNLPKANIYYADAGKYASDFFRLRNITHSNSLDSIKETVDKTANELVARHMLGCNGFGFRFLDAGGATGNRLIDIENLLGGKLEKYVVDIDALSVEKATQRGIQAKQNDLTSRLPYPNGYFDAVSLMWVLSCVPQDRQVSLISEIHRILKPGGIFYLEDEKYGVFSGDEDYFENVLKPLGYTRETFFAGIFEPSGLNDSYTSNAPESILDASDRNPAYRLITLPLAIHLIRFDKLKKTTSKCFNLESAYLMESMDEEQLGNVISSDPMEIEQLYENSWGIFLTIMRK